MESKSDLSDVERAQAVYRAAGLLTDDGLLDFLSVPAAANPGAPAVIGLRRNYSHGELWFEVEALARRLAGRGLRPGETAVLQMGNDESFVLVFLALVACGVAPVLALPVHRQAELTHFALASGARWMILSDRLGDHDASGMIRALRQQLPEVMEFLVVEAGDVPKSLVAAVPVDPQPDRLPVGAPAFFLLSGGTTGLPKLIPRCQSEYVYNIRVSAANAGMDASTRYLAALPMAHNFGLGCPGILGCLSHGGVVVMTPSADPQTCLELIERHRITHTALVPSLAGVWSEARQSVRTDVSSLRRLQVGGARVAPALAQRLIQAFPGSLQQSYGMGEGLLSQTRMDDDEWHLLHTQGRPLSPMDEVRIVDEEGRCIEERPGRGELQVRGPYTIRAYFNAESHNQKAFTADGFFCTGDRVRVEADGALVIEGRANDVINRGGDKIGPDEIEDHLLHHDAVRDVAVVGVPDASLGHRTCVVVVASRQLRLPELRDFLRTRGLADYKLPDRLLQLEQLPKTAFGKTDRRRIQRDLLV
ncbi:(2,3-dihydroxybenzoyl)adenylate synthase [Rubrivivax sp. RP6-9]|uniref:(2,3-dihydroxybenzoyl)adenylate synthase n=1 Tax=Rubrivivax sp. RP6-9 TaxID=3415750 RepID=UPI003CC6D059